MNLIGQRMGQYEILSQLGEGGMAVVYRARQMSVRREVALKIISPSLAARGGFSRRFEKEAQIIASLSNPHIVKVFDYGVMHGFHWRLTDAQVDPKTDLYYFVMEMLTGGSLSDRLEKGVIPLAQITRILEQMALALDYAHGRGTIHRDLKPPNVLFDDQGNAYLTDFGIAKLLGETSSLTQEGTTVGTPSYMAPEQWASENMGPPVDLYALGVVLFEMLTGRLPYVASSPYRVMHMHLNDPIPSAFMINPELPPAVDGVIARAMAKAPEERFESAAALVSAYKDALSGAPVRVNAPESAEASRQAVVSMVVDSLASGSGAPATGAPRAALFIGLVLGLLLILVLVLLFLASRSGAHPADLVGLAVRAGVL
ncbi:MAG: serine/threonine protein kinase [Anaerolineae bacterium]|nr:serine/threonine protein kinase [Anaerolineae bacterium]